jgi:hypothetical protein
MPRTPRRLPAAAPAEPHPSPPPLDEPRRRVGTGWVTAFAIGWLGIWMAQLTPVQLLLPLQVAAAQPGTDWVGSVVGFGVISGIAGACALVAYPWPARLPTAPARASAGVGRGSSAVPWCSPRACCCWATRAR